MANHLPGYEGVKVLGARVVIKLEEEENKTLSGLIIVRDHEEPKYEGLVVATGDGIRLETGVKMPMDISAGDYVIYSRLAGVPIEYNDEKLLVINERDVIAIIDNKTKE